MGLGQRVRKLGIHYSYSKAEEFHMFSEGNMKILIPYFH